MKMNNYEKLGEWCGGRVVALLGPSVGDLEGSEVVGAVVVGCLLGIGVGVTVGIGVGFIVGVNVGTYTKLIFKPIYLLLVTCLVGIGPQGRARPTTHDLPPITLFWGREIWAPNSNQVTNLDVV